MRCIGLLSVLTVMVLVVQRASSAHGDQWTRLSSDDTLCTDCPYEGEYGKLPNPYDFPDNCSYVVCRRVTGPSGYTYYFTEMNCSSHTEWDQSLLTCVHSTNPNCIRDIPDQLPTGFCPLRNVTGNNTLFIYKATGHVEQCPPGTVFSQDNCTCVHGPQTLRCVGPLLYFPFDEDMNSRGCVRAVGVEAGSGDVSLGWTQWKYVNDHGAHFDGNSVVLVPFLKNWFAQKNVQKLSVSFWTRWGAGDSRRGLVANSYCEHATTFGVVVDSGEVYSFVTTDTDGKTETARVPMPEWSWTHLAFTYDGSYLRMYVNADKPTQVAVSGPLTNSHCSMTIGQEGTRSVCYFYVGIMDDVALFDRVLTGDEVKSMSQSKFNYGVTYVPV